MGRIKTSITFKALLLVVALVVLPACWPETRSGDIVYEHDSAVLDDQGRGLKLEVVSFNWRYLEPTDQLKITGTAVNKTGQALQGVRILAEVFDQFDKPLGKGETYLVPTYLAAGAEANFDFYLPTGKWVEAVFMRCRFEMNY